MGPQALSQVLRQVDFSCADENLIVGLEKADDAIAYQVNQEQIIIQSIDFFTPIVDDPYRFGQIAAANALSDVYAMGGSPITAMNVVGFPNCLEGEILSKILQGGADKVAEAGAVIAGGHTVEDDEPKYGLSVMGQTKPEQLLTNDNAQPGDKLILTKPLGMGIVSTAIKGGLADEEVKETVIASMARLNNQAGEIMSDYEINACTDITGFGLLGHAWEMAENSGVQIEISAAEAPVFDKVKEYAEMGLVPAGAYSNEEHLGANIDFNSRVEDSRRDILFDPQTSGGLLISVPQEEVSDFLIELYSLGIDEAGVVGEVIAGEPRIKVI